MDWPASEVHEPDIVTNKPVSNAVVGRRIWILTGEGKPRRFFLRGVNRPAFGGRWNAGSNKRGGGTSIEPRDYAHRLLAKYMALAGV